MLGIEELARRLSSRPFGGRRPSRVQGTAASGDEASVDAHESRRQALILASCVALSILGLVLHNAREFGPTALTDPSTGTIPYASIQLVLFPPWVLSFRIRPAVEIALVTTAALQLVAGGILSVLPLPFLPFEPEQSLDHYISHISLALLQLPLLISPLRLRSARKTLSPS